MKHVVGTVVVHTTVSTLSAPEGWRATPENIRMAAELAVMSLMKSTALKVRVLLSDGSDRTVTIDATEAGA